MFGLPTHYTTVMDILPDVSEHKIKEHANEAVGFIRETIETTISQKGYLDNKVSDKLASMFMRYCPSFLYTDLMEKYESNYISIMRNEWGSENLLNPFTSKKILGNVLKYCSNSYNRDLNRHLRALYLENYDEIGYLGAVDHSRTKQDRRNELEKIFSEQQLEEAEAYVRFMFMLNYAQLRTQVVDDQCGTGSELLRSFLICDLVPADIVTEIRNLLVKGRCMPAPMSTDSTQEAVLTEEDKRILFYEVFVSPYGELRIVDNPLMRYVWKLYEEGIQDEVLSHICNISTGQTDVIVALTYYYKGLIAPIDTVLSGFNYLVNTATPGAIQGSALINMLRTRAMADLWKHSDMFCNSSTSYSKTSEAIARVVTNDDHSTKQETSTVSSAA